MCMYVNIYGRIGNLVSLLTWDSEILKGAREVHGLGWAHYIERLVSYHARCAIASSVGAVLTFHKDL